jgi:hypothetical protein
MKSGIRAAYDGRSGRIPETSENKGKKPPAEALLAGLRNSLKLHIFSLS